MLLRLLALAILAALPVSATEIKVAAASDLNSALRELASDFQRKTGYTLLPSYGSSGNFFSQIQNGAPYDIFMSADADYPSKLVASGLAEPASLYRYARGSLVLWVPASSKLDPRVLRFKLLLDPSVTKVALANPRHAPYGRAAEAALNSVGIYAQVAPKLVIGENISQAAQFVETGNAQAGLIALSLALAPSMHDKGRYWQLPDSAYPSLDQAAVVLKMSRQPAAARSFLDYLRTPAARTILARYGFREASRTSKSQ